MVNRPIIGDCVLDFSFVDRIPYLLQNRGKFVRQNGPRIVISASKVCERRDEESSPSIVGCCAKRKVIVDKLLVDPTARTLRPRGAARSPLSSLGWWWTQLRVFIALWYKSFHANIV